MDSEGEKEEDRAREKQKERKRNLKGMVSTCEILMENQDTHIFSRWQVDFMLRVCCRGVGEVRDEENYWKHHPYLESHLHCKLSARGGGGVGDGRGRVQAAFVWLSTKGLRENFQS
jgi:hypothetical protein